MGGWNPECKTTNISGIQSNLSWFWWISTLVPVKSYCDSTNLGLGKSSARAGQRVGAPSPRICHNADTASELLWAVYALVQVLHQSDAIEFYQLGDSWEQWLNYTKTNAAKVSIPDTA